MTKTARALLAGSAAFLLTMNAAACSPNSQVHEVPVAVRGEWTTESAEYAGRAFHLSAHELTIVVDEHTQYVHNIDRIEVRERNGRPFMTFYHRNRDGIDDTFRIEYAEYPSTFIRLENVDHVRWQRTDESTSD